MEKTKQRSLRGLEGKRGGRGCLAFSVVVGHGPHRCFKVCGRLLLDLVGMVMDLEPVETRHKLVGRSLGPVLRMHHEQHVREAWNKTPVR